MELILQDLYNANVPEHIIELVKASLYARGAAKAFLIRTELVNYKKVCALYIYIYERSLEFITTDYEMWLQSCFKIKNCYFFFNRLYTIINICLKPLKLICDVLMAFFILTKGQVHHRKMYVSKYIYCKMYGSSDP